MADDRYYRKLHLTIISAQNLQNVRKLFHNKVHARITIGGDQRTEKRTPTDKRNGLDPAWNYRVGYDVKESGIKNHGVPVVIKFYCSRSLKSDRYMGEVHTSVKELFDHAKSVGEESAILTVPIKRGAVDTSGLLKFSYSFGERTLVSKRAFIIRWLKAGASLLMREKIGKMVVGFLRGPKTRPSWLGRRFAESGGDEWFGPDGLIRIGDV